MSEQNPYKTLGLVETASFEEIQAAKQKLSTQYQGDRAVVDELEAAYDAIIMDRLRQRQQGTLEVPDQIRFAETPPKEAKVAPVTLDMERLPQWLTDLRDTPEPQTLNLALGINGAIAIVGLFLSPELASTILTAALMVNIYLIYRKEQRFGRAALISVVALILGIGLGSGLNALLSSLNVTLAIATEQILLIASSLTFGLSTSLLR
ncbi:CPP1-like family protein [Picosynechococcus sp. NKBG15041c]|uniref:CPP1-like family protein n=1 Tax=Picosynechococcus sp. NKBG15041c TaxID=1407650 RepID=UPI0004167AC4|nr:CPP1-like family protein [Picosynechococcus sp. NKBG15041c]